MKTTAFAFFLFFLLNSDSVSAGPWDEADLAEASRYVEEQSRRQNHYALQADGGIAMQLMPRFYRVGDRWTISVSRISHGMIRRNTEKEAKENRELAPVLYSFNVVEIDRSNGNAQIDVVESRGPGDLMPPSRITKLRLEIDPRFHIVSKQYFYRDQTNPVVASLGTEDNVPIGFDPFPVELPNFQEATVSVASNESFEMKSPDLFKRTVKVLWRKGDLWPTQIESPSGRYTLVKQEIQK
ncbi:MAG: hypothetical protein AB1540_13760 [Bdellovibrionota bacterium]